MTTRELKRFYREVSVAPHDGGFTILLDGKTVKTPARAALAVPTRGLAEAVADEWRAQETTICPGLMPLTALANTAIDHVAAERAAVLTALAGFGAYDLLCYRSEDAALALREASAWDPLLAWAVDRYGVPLKVTVGVNPVVQETTALAKALAAYDDFALAGLSPVITITGSFILGVALAEGRVDASAAFALCRIDEAYQAEKWGIDKEAQQRAHALEHELAAASAFITLART